MNKLAGQLCYLCGFIDDNPVEARGWRQDMKEFLNSIQIGALDPCDKPVLNVNTNEDEQFVGRVNELKTAGKYDDVTRIMRDIVRVDLKMVDLSSFLVLNINRDYHMCGSYSEFTYACMQRKPTFIYCKQGVEKISNWIWGLGDYTYFYDDWDKLKAHIKDVAFNDDIDDLDKKWRWFDYPKIFGEWTK